MLSICDSLRGSRREFLRIGGVTALGVSLPQLLAANDSLSAPKKSCIFLWLAGGPSQLETWDPKPLAPAEIRGEFGVIGTSTPGYVCSELMPRTSLLTDHIAVLRAVSTDCGIHDISGYWLMTGRKHRKMGLNVEAAGELSREDWPAMASVVRNLTQTPGELPSAVLLPELMRSNPYRIWPGQDGGFLGQRWDPWFVFGDPNDSEFRVPDLGLLPEIPSTRLERRLSLLDQVDHGSVPQQATRAESAFHDSWASALDLLQSQRARSAFDLSQENDVMRDRYGRNKFGQSCLLARRLVEAGVRFVQVTWPRVAGDETSSAPVWDTHADNARRMQQDLMPPMDLAYSALIEDLENRGLLEDTLVVWIGEFGRTPRHNAIGGRDHWGNVFSVALAGGGIRGGVVHGSSDEIAGYPADGRVEPQDLTATIFHTLGFRPETTIQDRLDRPLAISDGNVLHDLLV